jgi:hypothetical protein
MPELTWKYIKTPLDGDNLIAELAEKIGITLPNTYTELAEKHNGGRPDKKIFSSSSGRLEFRRLLRIDSNGGENIMDIFTDLLPCTDTLFPFGDDSFGNYFCFAQKEGLSYPVVVFFDHENGNWTEISESFEQFLDGLQ